MTPLLKKLLRNINQGKGQFIAVVAVVTIGIMVYVGMSGTYYNLKQAQVDFYQVSNFADYYFNVVKAPEGVVKEIEALPGVKRATGRITLDVPILKEDNKRATARIVSYPVPMDKELNRLSLNAGRMFSSGNTAGIEINTNSGFATANDIKWGDNVRVIHEGKSIYLSVVGTANSPEFIYPIKDIADLLPDHENFGIFMLPQDEASSVFNYSGQINQLLVEFIPQSQTDQIIEEIKDLLKPYGLLTSYSRDDQISHALLDTELTSIKSLTLYLPLIFLAVAAAIQFVILRRMVRNQKAQIGIMKALGYANVQIIWHYALYALLVGLIGAILGVILGIWFAGALTDYFLLYFNLPMQAGGYNSTAIIYGFALSIGVGLVAGWSAARQVTKIEPAESMRPNAPKAGSKSIVEIWPALWQRLSVSLKISLRSISRNRGRFMLTVTGTALAVALLVVSYFMNDAVDYMMKSFYYDQKYDLIIRTAMPIKSEEMLSIAAIDGVLQLEPFLEVPVRMTYGQTNEEEVLTAYEPNMALKKIVDEKGLTLNIPPQGLLLSYMQAEKLGVRVGDDITIETLLPQGPSHQNQLRVIGISHQMIGSATYVDLQVANNLLAEKDLVSGAMLKIEAGKMGAVEEILNNMNNIAAIGSREKEIANIEANLGAMIYTVGIMVLLAMILGLVIVYNASLMSFVERERELASLKLIGYSNQELAGLLAKENMLQSILGIIIGLPLGKLMAVSFISSIETDLYSFPVIIYPLTYVWATLSAVLFIIIAHFLVIRGIKHINLVETLKNQD